MHPRPFPMHKWILPILSFWNSLRLGGPLRTFLDLWSIVVFFWQRNKDKSSICYPPPPPPRKWPSTFKSAQSLGKTVVINCLLRSAKNCVRTVGADNKTWTLAKINSAVLTILTNSIDFSQGNLILPLNWFCSSPTNWPWRAKCPIQSIVSLLRSCIDWWKKNRACVAKQPAHCRETPGDR